MLIPDKKIALRKVLTVLNDVASDAAGNEKLQNQVQWMTAAIQSLFQLEDTQFYFHVWTDGIDLVREGVTLENDEPTSDLLRLLGNLPRQLDESASTDILRIHIAKVQQYLAQIVALLSKRKGSRIAGYLDRVADWENSIHRHMVSSTQESLDEAPPAFSRDRVEAYLRTKYAKNPNLVVSFMKILHGGFSKQTILVTISDDGRELQSLVLRAERAPKLVHFDGSNVAKEFSALRYLFYSGLPVPEPLWLEQDESLFGSPFLVSRRALGSSLGMGLSSISSLPPQTQESILARLAQIHAHKVDSSNSDFLHSHLHDWTGFPTLRESTLAAVKYWNGEFVRAGCATTPIMERAYHWLLKNVPDEQIDPVILHGDYGLANVLVENGEVTAILDWELSAIGDPAYDLVNFMHEYDPALIRIYERYGGSNISEYRFLYFTIMKVLKAAPLLNALHLLETDARAHLNYYLLASYIHYLTGPLNSLIERAERIKPISAVSTTTLDSEFAKRD